MKREKYPGTIEEPESTGGEFCVAHGCPMHGSMSTSTSGPKQDWLCWLHFGKDASEWQQITFELNRVRWLVDATRILRHAKGSNRWPEAVREVRKLLVGAQRSDLLYAQNETAASWMARLDRALLDMVRSRQQELVEA